VRAASVQVANTATRLLAMYTRDLEPLVYDQPKFIDAIKKLVLARGYAKVRVLIADPAKTVYESSRFIGLARRITSYIEIRHAHTDFRVNRAAFLIADDRHRLPLGREPLGRGPRAERRRSCAPLPGLLRRGLAR